MHKAKVKISGLPSLAMRSVFMNLNSRLILLFMVVGSKIAYDSTSLLLRMVGESTKTALYLTRWCKQ